MPGCTASRLKGLAHHFGILSSRAAKGCCATLESVLRPALAQLPGVFLEDKGVALVAHYRAAAEEDGERAQEVFLRHARAGIDSGVLRVMQGACVLELLPNIDWDKGSAVDWISERVSRQHSNVWPLYIGDDITDEDAFRAVAAVWSVDRRICPRRQAPILPSTARRRWKRCFTRSPKSRRRPQRRCPLRYDKRFAGREFIDDRDTHHRRPQPRFRRRVHVLRAGERQRRHRRDRRRPGAVGHRDAQPRGVRRALRGDGGVLPRLRAPARQVRAAAARREHGRQVRPDRGRARRTARPRSRAAASRFRAR